MSNKRNKQPSSFKTAMVVGFLWLSSRFPLWFSQALGRGVAKLVAISGSSMAKVTHKNLQMCYPQLSEAERLQMQRQCLAATGMLMFETSAIWMRDYEWVRSRILAVRNREVLDDALASDSGTILLAPHLGNWEVLGLYLSEKAEVTSLYQPPDMQALEPIIRQSREKVGAKLVPTNRKGVAALLKTLKTGGFTAILPDQVPDPSGGEFADFFGIPALTMTLIYSLMQRSNCTVIAAVAKRVPGGFEIIFEKADEGVYSADQGEALAALNRTVENCVALAPDQYQWEYKRFRKQPDGTNPYNN